MPLDSIRVQTHVIRRTEGYRNDVENAEEFTDDELRVVSRGLKNIMALAYNPQNVTHAEDALAKVQAEMRRRRM